VVRNGKLRRKILLDTINHQLKYLIRNRPCYGWLYKRYKIEDNTRVFITIFPENGRHMMFCRDPDTDDTIYLYRKMLQLDSVWDYMWEAQFVSVTLMEIDLSPFIKHSYPSYPFTHKKINNKRK